MKSYLTKWILAAIILSACAPSQSQVQTAIALTQTAMPTSTPTFIPTETIMPTTTITFTPAATITPTETFTPSPTPDIRIIEAGPQKFVLLPEDLPKEGYYYLPNSTWAHHYSNEEIISNWTVEKGRAYVISSGRVDGWRVAYARGTRAVAMPDEVECQIVIYKTTEGALLALDATSLVKRFPRENWKKIDMEMNLGYANNIESIIKITSGGDRQVSYIIAFAYRNVLVTVSGFGLEKDVAHDFVENAAHAVLRRLQEAPLSFPPTITPTP